MYFESLISRQREDSWLVEISLLGLDFAHNARHQCTQANAYSLNSFKRLIVLMACNSCS